MASEDERGLTEAIVTCEGNLHDPDFSSRFQTLVDKLKSLIYTKKEEPFKVKKIEPWNSVRVTISIPKEAAQKLRMLAQQGSQVLQQLGILSVQVDGDQIISLTLAGKNNEPQDVVLQTGDGGSTSESSSSSATAAALLSTLAPSHSSPALVYQPQSQYRQQLGHAPQVQSLQSAGPSGTSSISTNSNSGFRIPNVVAPSGESIPILPPNTGTHPPRPTHGGPFPFASMTHAVHTMQRSETVTTASGSSPSSSSSSALSSPAFCLPTSNGMNNSNNSIKSTNALTMSFDGGSPLLLQQNQIQAKQQTVLLTQRTDPTRFVYNNNISSSNVNLIRNSVAVSQAMPSPSPSQSLQIQFVNVNDPSPYLQHQPHPVQPSSQNHAQQYNSGGGSGANVIFGADRHGSSPLLVNLLQHGDGGGPPSNSVSPTSTASQPSSSRSMPPPPLSLSLSVDSPKVKRYQLLQQQRKMKRGLSLDTQPPPSPSFSPGISPQHSLSSHSEPGSPFSHNDMRSPDPGMTNAHSDPAKLHNFTNTGTYVSEQTHGQGRLGPNATIVSQPGPGNARALYPAQIVAIQHQHQHQVQHTRPQIRVGLPFNQAQPQMQQSQLQMPASHQQIQFQARQQQYQHQQSTGLTNGPCPPRAQQHHQFIQNQDNTVFMTSMRSNSGPAQPQQQHQQVILQYQQLSHSNQNQSVHQQSEQSGPKSATNMTTMNVNKIVSQQSQGTEDQFRSFIPINSTSTSVSSGTTSSTASVSSASAVSSPKVTFLTPTAPPPRFISSMQRAIMNCQEDDEKPKPSHQVHRRYSLKGEPPQSPSSGKPRLFLINPLTGHLEPMPSESSSESEEEDGDDYVGKGKGKGPRGKGKHRTKSKANPPRPGSGKPMSVVSIGKGKRASFESNPETSRLEPQLQNFFPAPIQSNPLPPPAQPGLKERDPQGEKIKLRLKLEKNEPAYKVDLGFVKKPEPSVMSVSGQASPLGAGFSLMSAPAAPTDQPRVPPLHISLRGRNAAVVVSPRRDEKDHNIMTFDPAPVIVRNSNPPSASQVVAPAVSPTTTTTPPTLSQVKLNSNFVTSNSNIVMVRPGGAGGRAKNRLKSGSESSKSSKAGKATRPKPTKSAPLDPMTPGYVPAKVRQKPKSASISSERLDFVKNLNQPLESPSPSLGSIKGTDLSTSGASTKSKKKSRRKSEITPSKSLFESNTPGPGIPFQKDTSTQPAKADQWMSFSKAQDDLKDQVTVPCNSTRDGGMGVGVSRVPLVKSLPSLEPAPALPVDDYVFSPASQEFPPPQQKRVSNHGKDPIMNNSDPVRSELRNEPVDRPQRAIALVPPVPESRTVSTIELKEYPEARSTKPVPELRVMSRISPISLQPALNTTAEVGRVSVLKATPPALVPEPSCTITAINTTEPVAEKVERFRPSIIVENQLEREMYTQESKPLVAGLTEKLNTAHVIPNEFKTISELNSDLSNKLGRGVRMEEAFDIAKVQATLQRLGGVEIEVRRVITDPAIVNDPFARSALDKPRVELELCSKALPVENNSMVQLSTPSLPTPPDEHALIGVVGVPGEDSGIDSMDALSEKSPNQGESPARKEQDALFNPPRKSMDSDPLSANPVAAEADEVTGKRVNALETSLPTVEVQLPAPKINNLDVEVRNGSLESKGDYQALMETEKLVEPQVADSMEDISAKNMTRESPVLASEVVELNVSANSASNTTEANLLSETLSMDTEYSVESAEVGSQASTEADEDSQLKLGDEGPTDEAESVYTETETEDRFHLENVPREPAPSPMVEMNAEVQLIKPDTQPPLIDQPVRPETPKATHHPVKSAASVEGPLFQHEALSPLIVLPLQPEIPEPLQQPAVQSGLSELTEQRHVLREDPVAEPTVGDSLDETGGVQLQSKTEELAADRPKDLQVTIGPVVPLTTQNTPLPKVMELEPDFQCAYVKPPPELPVMEPSEAHVEISVTAENEPTLDLPRTDLEYEVNVPAVCKPDTQAVPVPFVVNSSEPQLPLDLEAKPPPPYPSSVKPIPNLKPIVKSPVPKPSAELCRAQPVIPRSPIPVSILPRFDAQAQIKPRPQLIVHPSPAFPLPNLVRPRVVDTQHPHIVRSIPPLEIKSVPKQQQPQPKDDPSPSGGTAGSRRLEAIISALGRSSQNAETNAAQEGTEHSGNIPNLHRTPGMPNVIRLSNAKTGSLTGKLQQQHSPSLISLPPGTVSISGSTPGNTTMITIPANLSHHLHAQHQQHSQSITVLPSGHKVVPIKLVTVPKGGSGPGFNSPLRSSPTILEAVSISRAGSPGTKIGSPLQTTPLNLSSVGGNLTLLPLSPNHGQNPVKVLVSSPVKMQGTMLQSMVVMGNPNSAQIHQPRTFRVVRPGGGFTDFRREPGGGLTMSHHQEPPLAPEPALPPVSLISTPQAVATQSSGSTGTAIPISLVEPTFPSTRLEDFEDGLELLDGSDEEFPFEADIIHDEKDLVDALAAAKQETIAQNGIDSHHKNPRTELTKRHVTPLPNNQGADPPLTSRSPPLQTYPRSLSISLPAADIHGEDQEIIDTFSKSPSSPQDRIGTPKDEELLSDHTYVVGNSRGLEALSIEIPGQEEKEDSRMPTRSTRSNTRIVSPDITAFTPSRSETPKPVQAAQKHKAEPTLIRNSPKPSPTGSTKLLSPTPATMSSARSSPIPQSGLVNSGTSAWTQAGSKGRAGTSNRRRRQESDSSSTSKDENIVEETKVELVELNSRPGKRRCSENAAELIKACIGVEDTPKRNTLLIKRLEEANKLKEAKARKAMLAAVEEAEDELEPIDLLLRGKSGRSSRGSSEDRSSSRGSSVNRHVLTNSKSVPKDEDKPSGRTKNRSVQSKEDGGKGRLGPDVESSPLNSNKDGKNNKGRKPIRSTLPPKKKSPLATSKGRVNMKKESHLGGSSGSEKASTPTTSPENENSRRKTRSSVAVGNSDSDSPALKRRRISKDTKS